MIGDLFFYYILLTSVFLLSGVLIIVIQYLLNVIKQNKSYQKDILHHSQAALDEAREKAHEIISAANDRAREIISQTEMLKQKTLEAGGEIESKLLAEQGKELERARAQIFEEYKKTLDNLYRENVNLFKTISKDIEEKAASEIRDFKEILEKETVASQKIVGEKIEDRYKEVERELEEYKNTELAKVKENINKIIQNAAMAAIGKSLNIEAHEELALDALREAIEENKLNQNG
jgi:F0F1-type ATP synthase membrane subunit b/b'